MAKGGFKVLVNGKVERCFKFSVDFDTGKLQMYRESGAESVDFDRKTFAVMAVTNEDMVN